jgi:transposase
MTPRYGRAPRGERVVGTAPRNHGKNTTLVAALSLDGISAAMTVEGAMDRLAFDVFVERILAPSLTPGQVVVWDNLSVHKSDDAWQAIAARGCHLLWLPPYSPDFAPIEQALSKLKTALRRAAARWTRPSPPRSPQSPLPTPGDGASTVAPRFRPNSSENRSSDLDRHRQRLAHGDAFAIERQVAEIRSSIGQLWPNG